MYPVNQVILGGDSMFNSNEDIDFQLKRMDAYKLRLEELRDNSYKKKLIWDEIDSEISPMTSEQKNRLMSDPEYSEVYLSIQSLVQQEVINIVKDRIESTPKGKELLGNQLKIVKKLKGKIINDTNKEMEMFMKFREYSKNNPNVTYEEFIKQM